MNELKVSRIPIQRSMIIRRWPASNGAQRLMSNSSKLFIYRLDTKIFLSRLVSSILSSKIQPLIDKMRLNYFLIGTFWDITLPLPRKVFSVNLETLTPLESKQFERISISYINLRTGLDFLFIGDFLLIIINRFQK